MQEIPVAFDWWRCGGRIIKAPAPLPPPFCPQQQQQQAPQLPQQQLQHPSRRWQTARDPEENWWPTSELRNDRNFVVSSGPSDPYGMDCEVSRDYWHEPYKTRPCAKKCKEGPRPAWCPTKIPPGCSGLVHYPPPYARYCRSRDKPVCFICRP